MSLRQKLIEQITLEGPLSVADYMTQCLLDPHHGYYTRHVSLGADGDFLTAPLVSQMFGEMIGVWLAETWREMGAPPAFRLVEIGGGDGTLMRDILRVAARVPGLRQAAQAVMIEPSQALRALQAAVDPGISFADALHAIATDLPVILIANEVLDCLPARQFVQTEKGWFERRIGLIDGQLGFGLVEIGPDFTPPEDSQQGDIIEISLAQMRFGEQIGGLLRKATGAALLIDYGRDTPGAGDTLQALHRHQKTDPLAEPGRHDLTMWADFPAVAAAAQAAGARVALTTQGEYLHRLGIATRLDALGRLHPVHAPALQRQYERLTADDQMGRLFKVLGVAFPTTIRLIGVEAGESPL
ncbi:SAM-dependent methyltransferase [Asticcacaulis sp. EMRT-3]|uniref:class I SAM-dependent methyltransferase n=1 Tax=Asticcacaulis sp. EMRT-3 TaxID=3040349 RepID=UPI0024AFCC6F|nr:SAM-dependent methyltransferase [Asticcacaulis sp. EMRT-3]MDI7774874.1 SAM-dependent methyltransferase [Asticcacaulis sp. EMRT-3]